MYGLAGVVSQGVDGYTRSRQTIERGETVKVYAIDFDNTLFKTTYPTIISPMWRTIRRVKRLQDKGHKIILNTCRVEPWLSEAVEACRQVGLEFDAVNANLPERIAQYGGDCRKISADIYIDDKNKFWRGVNW